ncbi:3-isopropylmalate dehydratase [Candidimonas humi]|uniref:Aconitase family protein n=1 Tax=Candidimonas humi TaxID=683355 RepID=A0ABV8P0R5_9BURK|nr:aconitase family protein [Candidimonas humi]MBV6306939.1 3-isopropylmalate dehydratase [Candidimonas humi]
MEKIIRFTGRILYLSQDPACIEAQLAGADLSLAEAMPLRDDVSTDEITPVTVMFTYDERLGRYPYVGFKAGERLPIGPDAVRNGGFCVTVAGKRYGKGSSRESSPLAERAAGIRLIIAESFERIYQQNCDNLGIYTSTDFGLLDRIRAGEAIGLDEFLQGRDELTREIVASGGLMAYSKAASWPDPATAAAPLAAAPRPRTLVEKIIERHLHPGTPMAPGAGVFVAADWRFSHDYFTGMSAYMMDQAFGPDAALLRPERIVAFQDHLVLAPQSVPHVRDGLLPGVANLERGHRDFTSRHPVRVHGALPDGSGSDGICHAVMAEQYALPGQVVVGTDSHTPHSGALGCLAFGAGATEVANSWVTGYVRCGVAPTLRVEIDGQLRPGVTAKDIVLHLLRQDAIRNGEAIGAVFEYTGSAMRALPVDERATLTNMVAELGGFTGIVAPDERTVAFLKERRGMDFEIEPWMASDPDAQYKATIRLDAAAIGPMLARPGDPGKGMAADDLAEAVPVDIAYGGSCTAGKREDFDYYHEVLSWGLEQGLRIAPGTRLYLQFGTLDVRRYCLDRGYMDTFEQAGVTLVMPGCGACANCGPGQSTSASQVTISAINRNFPGRSGPGQVWLASPYTVAASALAGRIISFASLREAHR